MPDSIYTDQLAHYGFMVIGTDILGGLEPENDTDNFGYSSLEGATVNCMMKCDGRWEVYHQCI